MGVFIINCRIVSPDVNAENASIEIDGNAISRIHTEPLASNLLKGSEVVDAMGGFVFPGFIDIHTHGAAGADVCDGKVDSIERIAKAKLEEGVTTFCPTTLTMPVEALEKACLAVEAYNKDARFSKVEGMHLEGPFVNCEAAGAQDTDYMIPPDIELVKRLNSITKVSIVSLAVELAGGMSFLNEIKGLGIVGSCGHSRATYAQIQEAKKNGLSNLTHFCNQMLGMHHREVGMVGAGLLDDDLNIEMICDRIHLSAEMIRLAVKSKKDDNLFLITDSMAASHLSDGMYKLGKLDVKVENSVARLVMNGAIAGSTLKYYVGLKNASEITGKPLSKLIKASSYNQARILGIHNLGKIEEGFLADIVVAGKDFVPSVVLVEGKVHRLDTPKVF